MKPSYIFDDTDRARAGSPFMRAARAIEQWAPLDPIAAALARLSDAVTIPALRGDWLGHALHPMLTDAAIGLWSASTILDVAGGETSRPAARRLVGLGLVAAVPTAVTGLAEWKSLPNRASRRVATVHAVGNSVVLVLYLRSWLLRRGGRQAAGVRWALAGGVLAAGTGYLGGHLSFGLGVGIGERGGTDPELPEPRT
ncbi:MAG: DUF2231 domain-containing protein [Acidimicrobiia bacterium]